MSSPDPDPMTSKPSTPSTRIRRWPVLIAAVLVVAGAIAVSQVKPEKSVPFSSGPISSSAAVIAAPRALSTAWYCAEGSSDIEGRASETVIIGNLEKRPVSATVSVMTGNKATDVTQQLKIAAYGQKRIEVADLVEATNVGVVVEIFDGRAVVEHEIVSGNDFAVGACATRADSRWYFADISTDRSAQSWLTLFNPFGDDAIVDVKFLTESGIDIPDSTQALSVPRRTQVSIPIHETIRRQSQVAAVVQARTGRVVSEISQYFDGTDTRSGVALSLGANKTEPRWVFPVGDGQSGSTQSISLANFGSARAQVELKILLGGTSSLSTDRVDVPSKSVVRVDIGGQAPAGLPYSVEVRSDLKTKIVAEAFATWAAPAPITGVASVLGSPEAANKWAFAVGRISDANISNIEVLNVTSRAITVQLYAYVEGDPDSPRSAPASALGPNERAVFNLTELGIGPDQVLVISADGPVVVGRSVSGPGISIAPGVPFAKSIRRIR